MVIDSVCSLDGVLRNMYLLLLDNFVCLKLLSYFSVVFMCGWCVCMIGLKVFLVVLFEIKDEIVVWGVFCVNLGV